MKSPEAAITSIRVWVAPVRVFHALLIFSFVGAYLTAESERWRLMHITLGYTVGSLVLFRLVWGVLGTRYARFGSFVRGPATTLEYLKGLLRGKPAHYHGHNPAGAVAIVVLLSLGLLQWGSGWAIYNDVGGEWLEGLHEVAGNAMLAVVGVHLAGVLLGSWLHRESLVRSMVTGRKQGLPSEGISREPWSPMLALVLVAAVLSYWAFQWVGAPEASLVTSRQQESAKYPSHDKDND
jgi:cytochrome b